MRGNELCQSDRAHVLAAYIYRGTIENQRAHPQAVAMAGSRLPLITDAQWLEISEWPVTKSGRIDRRAKHCTTFHSEMKAHKAMIDEWSKTRAAVRK